MLGPNPISQPPGTFTWGEYRRYVREYHPRLKATKRLSEIETIIGGYGHRLPLTLLARCPFCASPVIEPVDTFSLNGFGWGLPPDGVRWSRLYQPPPTRMQRCTHVRIVTWFLNLRGLTPDDLFPDRDLQVGPEIPSVMLVPMAAEEAVAVMHEVPVGRFDDDELQHRYSVYFMTYLTEQRESFVEAIRGWGLEYGMVEYEDVDRDLAGWAERGRLRWLDPSDPELPLVSSEDSAFPYAEIEGDPAPYRTITREGVEGPEPRGLARLFRWRKR